MAVMDSSISSELPVYQPLDLVGTSVGSVTDFHFHFGVFCDGLGDYNCTCYNKFVYNAYFSFSFEKTSK